jgi:outer membrane protein
MRLLLICLLLPLAVFAECDNLTPANSSCIETEKLQLRLGFGAGHRSNPLAGGRNLPYWLIPDLSYYGKHWFFDNGSLGYSVELDSAWQLSIQSRLNEEKGYFQRAHPSNLFQRVMFNSAEVTGPAPRGMTKQAVNIVQVQSRPTAVDAGLQLDWFGPQLQVRMNWWHDISNTYHGQHASLSAQHGWSVGPGFWQLQATLYWKSADLMQTYYGIHEVEHELSYYQPSDSWQPELKLSYSHPLSSQWSALIFYRYRWLDHAMTESPLVVEHSIRGWFLGLSYQFF